MSASAAIISHPLRRGLAPVALVALLAGASAGPAAAQSAGGESSFAGVMETLGLKSRARAAPEFVERSRPGADALHYMPVGAPRSDAPAVKTMTPAEVAAATEALDQARVKQQRQAGLVPAAVPLKTAAKAKPARRKVNP